MGRDSTAFDELLFQYFHKEYIVELEEVVSRRGVNNFWHFWLQSVAAPLTLKARVIIKRKIIEVND